MDVRIAVSEDLERILEIYKSAQNFMIRSGNPNQWGHKYPAPELIGNDIKQGICRIIYDGSGIHGVFALFYGEDPTYGYIEGEWLNADPYVTIHRIAGDGKVHGVFKCAADHCKSISDNIRIDTHADNLPMQRQLDKNGFKKCGVIYLADGSPRTAYQWSKN